MNKFTLYLGANFISHDASIFGIIDNEFFAISEERFTRYKHDAIWPIESLKALQKFILTKNFKVHKIICTIPTEIQSDVCIVDRYSNESFIRKIINAPFLGEYLEREKSLTNRLSWFWLILKNLAKKNISVYEIFIWIRTRMVKRTLKYWVLHHISKIFDGVEIEVRYLDHHMAHALSASLISGFAESIVLTMDGYGDGAFTKAYVFKNNRLSLISESRSITVDTTCYEIPNELRRLGIFDELSVGHAYSIITWLSGFRPCADEGKVEALAAFGDVDNQLLSCMHLTAKVRDFNIEIIGDEYLKLFHLPDSHAKLKKIPKENLAATMQQFLEDIYLKLIDNLITSYGIDAISLSGGVAANVILNMKIFKYFDAKTFITPAMGDDGIAMGAAFSGIIQDESDYLNNISKINKKKNGMPYYGTEYSKSDVEKILNSTHGLPIAWEWVGSSWPKICADLVAHKNEIGAIFNGRCEFGPRALGNRSIIADLRDPKNTKRLNLLVKSRPGFQPFCPAFMQEELKVLFEGGYENLHMTSAFKMKAEYIELLPCAVHVDGTARVQFVTNESNFYLYQMLVEIKKISGYGGVINTSFNKHGRTICESPMDAIVDFLDCGIDFLIMEGYLIRRSEIS